MAKVFISYKYNDPFVYGGTGITCRDYVDAIQNQINEVHIYKGEEDGNDLSQFARSTIETRLKEKIRDSSVTIVLISKGMKAAQSERDQWIPWEVKYSLLKSTAEGRTSLANGLLAVVIPDESGSYGHYFTHAGCTYCTTVNHNTEWLFEIMKNNMFNRKQPKLNTCLSPYHNAAIHSGADHSYMHQVAWNDFTQNPSLYIQIASSHRDRTEEFNIQKRVLRA